MRKTYTAQSMREMANRERFKCSFVTRTLNGGIILDCTSDVRAMLLQAAEIRERLEAARRLQNVTVRADNSAVIAELQRRLKLAEEALEACVNYTDSWKLEAAEKKAKAALAQIRGEGGARKLIKCEVCGREVLAEQLYEGLCPTCERQMKTESLGGEQ